MQTITLTIDELDALIRNANQAGLEGRRISVASIEYGGATESGPKVVWNFETRPATD